MNARTLIAALALAAAPVLAAEPEPQLAEPQAPAAPDREPRAPIDIRGRLRASADGLSLEIAGAVLELRISGDPIAGGDGPGSAARGGHDFRATFSVDGKTTNLLLRIVPPPGEASPPEP